jgi:LuxR family transcriptional regulator, quorum-sensing system regulator SdiA
MKHASNILSILASVDKVCSAGYAMALHISFATPRFLFQTYDREWMAYYSQNGLVMKDPTVRWGFENTGHILWSDLSHLDTDNVLVTARKYGIHHGFTVSTGVQSSRSISSFARGDREFTPGEIAQICEMAEQLHLETADLKDLSAKDRDELKKISIEFTHG